MNMERIIEIAVRGLNAVQTNDMEYVCDNTEYIAVFDFDAEWDGVDPKTARFVYGEEHQDIVFTGNRCEIPRISDVNSMRVGVFAGNLVTTTPAQVICRKSILGNSGPPAEPAPDVYAQIMEVAFPAAVAAAEESARQAAESEQKAEAAETNAEQSAKNAAESAENLSTAEKNAKESAEQAKTSETNTKTSEGNAKTSENNAKASETAASGSASSATLAKENAEKAKTDAEAAATRAEIARQGIEQFASDVEKSATDAKAAAQNAEAAETNAAKSAEEAKTAEQNAKAYETQYAAYAQEVKTAAENAKNSASNADSDAKTASQKANDAKTSETNAANSASNAEKAATDAKASADNAANAEQNAKLHETNAKNSEEKSLDYASVAKTYSESALASENNAARLATNAEIHATNAFNRAKEAEASRQFANNSADRAATSAQNAEAAKTNAAKSAEEAKKAAESIALPTPTPEVAGKAVIVNASGDGFTLGEAAGGGSSGRAQSDWNAAEGEPGHILNRPFYDGILVDRVFAKRGLKLAEYDGISGFMMPDVVTVFTGEEYTVNYNGMDVNCTCVEITFMGLPMQAMGNLAAMNGVGNTGEPFVLLVVPAEYAGMIGFGIGIVPLDGSTTLNVSVRGLTPSVKPIPTKYLPRYTIVLNEDETIMTGVTPHAVYSSQNRDEFAELLYNGGDVWIDISAPLSVELGAPVASVCKVVSWLYSDSTGLGLYFNYMGGLATAIFINGTWTPPGYTPQ